jgi:hypothetical protein
MFKGRDARESRDGRAPIIVRGGDGYVEGTTCRSDRLESKDDQLDCLIWKALGCPIRKAFGCHIRKAAQRSQDHLSDARVPTECMEYAPSFEGAVPGHPGGCEGGRVREHLHAMRGAIREEGAREAASASTCMQ